jgi:hypothetical protein
MTAPTGNSAEIAKNSGVETLYHFVHPAGRSEFRFVPPLPISFGVTVSALSAQRPIHHPHLRLLRILSADSTRGYSGEQEGESQEAHVSQS